MEASLNRLAVITLTVFAWVIVSSVCAIWYVVNVLTSPEGGDAYAMNWQFQLLMFSIFRLPWLVMALPVIIVLNLIAFETWIQPRLRPARKNV